MKKNKFDIQLLRFISQIIFILFCIWIGIEFHFYIKMLTGSETVANITKPGGVEGFLPISALMSLYYFILTGEIHDAHPAGFVIFLAIIVMSIFLGKSFCSWFCPVGFLSETVGSTGESFFKKIFRRKITIHRYLDIPLRSLKYIILIFFVNAIFFSMSAPALKQFLDSPYNLIADIKMYYFFADITRFSLIVIGVLFLLSIVFRNFWCRYLCPYGALLGLLSFLSPFRITRDKETCIDCKKCTKVCPSRINVHKKGQVNSDECTSCMNCITACPVKDALVLKTRVKKRKISGYEAAAAAIILYLIIIFAGKMTDTWHGSANTQQLRELTKTVNTVGHP